ncbi:MAG TPA: hydantoinase/carbamoylase family amidase, partial [Thermomicrobiales bacterium]|nr:hydantoinase/carbamoylase family amidase [Thermomicrobiales bacterium]
FHTAYLGSRAWAGACDADLLARADANGATLAEAARQFGGDPETLLRGEGLGERLLGYVEAHIEQGPALEALGLPVGVVSAIAGQSRAAVAFSGMAGHAGTVAMPLRRDALPAAAEFVLAVEALARATDGLVATVGQIAVEPGASNVIPGRVSLSLDVRHPDDAIREDARERLRVEAATIAARRGLALAWDVLQENPAVACDPALSARLAEAVAAGGWPAQRLASGAGHDAVIVSRRAPVAMLFVRCAGGVSHNPAEAVTVEDVAVAVAVFDRLLDGIDRDLAAGAFAP